MSGSGAIPKVAIVGLGTQGTRLAERIYRRTDLELSAAVDVDPGKAGRPLDEVIGAPAFPGLVISDDLEAVRGADLVLVGTSSRIAEVGPQLEAIATLGVSAITTAEELAYPWHQFPEQSANLDEVARSNGVGLLGCGANPGFLMDLLPIVFTLGLERVEALRIARALDLRPQRPERLARFGLGLRPEEFAAADPAVLTGHVGFTQSIHCLADALDWELDEVREESICPAVIATERRQGEQAAIEPGTVAVIEHRAWATLAGARVVDISMYFGLHEAHDAVFHGDRYEIAASDQPVTIELAPSWGPFETTPSTAINLIAPLLAAEPGLRAVTDFPVKLLAAKPGVPPAAARVPTRNHLVTLTPARSGPRVRDD